MDGDVIDTGDDHFYSPEGGAGGSADPNKNPFDTLPGGDDDGKHEHIDLSWDGSKVSPSTRRGSAEDTRSKLSELEGNKDDAESEVLKKYHNADVTKVTAGKDEFNRTMGYLLNKKNAVKYPLLDDGTIGKSKKGGTPGKTSFSKYSLFFTV